MSLATRCSACGTIFRVVEDQLRVSDGWVRCGRCAEVFDARAQLFDIDREAPPPWPADAEQHPDPVAEEPIASAAIEPAATAAAVAPAYSMEPEPAPDESWPEEPAPGPTPVAEPALDHPMAATEHGPDQDSRFDARLEPHWSDEPLAPPAPAVAEASAAAALGKQFAAAAMMEEERPARPGGQQQAEEAEKTALTGNSALPEFLRSRAGESGPWQRPAVRLVLGLLALLLLASLLLQAGHHFRDSLAAHYPELRPTLLAACRIADCEIKARQSIESIGIESTGLNQAGSSGSHYQLLVSLHNKGSKDVLTPWIDVSLTDSAGALFAKRVLSPHDFRTDKLSMTAGSDLHLQTTLSTGGARVSGYSVEIFYP